MDKCLRKLLHICYLEHKTYEWMWGNTSYLVGPQEPSLATVKRQKFAWFRQVTCHNSLSKTIHQGTLEGERQRGDIPVHARTAHEGLLQKALEEDLC